MALVCFTWYCGIVGETFPLLKESHSIIQNLVLKYGSFSLRQRTYFYCSSIFYISQNQILHPCISSKCRRRVMQGHRHYPLPLRWDFSNFFHGLFSKRFENDSGHSVSQLESSIKASSDILHRMPATQRSFPALLLPATVCLTALLNPTVQYFWNRTVTEKPFKYWNVFCEELETLLPLCFFVFWEIKLKLDEWKSSLLDRIMSQNTLFPGSCGTDGFSQLLLVLQVSLSELKHTEIRTKRYFISVQIHDKIYIKMMT